MAHLRSLTARFLRNLRRLAAEQGGIVAILWALITPLLMGFIGLGVETGLWYMSKRTLQTAADAAAITGVWEKMGGSNITTITSKATTEATRNGWLSTAGAIAVQNPPTTGTHTTDASAVEVTLSRQQTSLFVELLAKNLNFPGTITLRARAVATVGNAGTSCVLALATSGTGISISGSAVFSMSGCSMFSNSTDSTDSISITGNADVTAASLAAAGTVYVGAPSATVNGSPQYSNQTARSDPYACPGGHCVDLPSGSATCTYNAKQTVNPSDTVTYTPASATTPKVFCGGADFRGVVHFDPGIYVFHDDMKINSGATITGTDVTLIFTNGGKFDVNGSANLSLTAPTSRNLSAQSIDLSGILIYGDRDYSGETFKVNGNSANILNGAVYVPTGDVEFEGNSTVGSAGCTQIVAQNVDIQGNSGILNNCSSSGTATITAPSGVKLVE